MVHQYRKAVTADRLRELLSYDPNDGLLRWRLRRKGQHRLPGETAGYIGADGYWKVRVDTVCYQAHRLIWLYMTGKWPKQDIDHENLDKADNRWINLREADHTGNMANVNARKTSVSASPLKGVYKDRRRDHWFSQIRVAGRVKRLGTFGSAIEAHRAWCEAARRVHGDFARTTPKASL